MEAEHLERTDYTIEEYFSLAAEAEQRLEYHDGTIIVMAGGTADHSAIGTDTGAYLTMALRDKPCEPFNNDLAISIPTFGRYVLPDFSIVCGAPEYEDERQTRLRNPTLIIEVLSRTTGQADQNKKFIWYRSLPSFREYVLIDSRNLTVLSYYRKSAEDWTIQSLYRRDQVLQLPSVGIELPLAEIYRRVQFDQA